MLFNLSCFKNSLIYPPLTRHGVLNQTVVWMLNFDNFCCSLLCAHLDGGDIHFSFAFLNSLFLVSLQKCLCIKPIVAGSGSQAMFSFSQPNLLANKKRKLILSTHISKESNGSVNFQWAPFPIEITGASVMVPSPSGSKLLVVRNSENESPTQFEIWGPSQLEKEFHVAQSTHGSVYSDGW